jgi:hypothetical protein
MAAMTIPVATTTVTVEATVEAEPGEGRTTVTVAAGVRAVIGSPSGSERPAPGGGTSRVTDVLNCDPCPQLADNTCRVIDDTTGVEYEVEWVRHRNGLGLDHTKAGLVQNVGRP